MSAGKASRPSLTARPAASPVEQVEDALERVHRAQPTTNAFTTILDDAARRRARALEGEHDAGGLLFGAPVAIKDMIDVEGTPTTGCCPAYAGRTATADADIVRALHQAGAIVVAKTNQHQLGFGVTGLISSAGPVRNPVDTDVLCGGSSGGSAAAVAAGCVPIAVGTDTGGSIRIPASFCGVVGLKPTPGAVSARGAMAMSFSIDSIGPITATVSDCALVWHALSGHTDAGVFPARPPGRNGLPVRIGLSPTLFDLLHPETRTAIENAAQTLASLDNELVDVSPVDLVEGDSFDFVWADAALEHTDIADDPGLHPEIASLLHYGRSLSGLDYARSRRHARQVRASFRSALASADVLLAPATPFPAPPARAETVTVEGGTLDVRKGGTSRFTAPVNLAGLPALAFPVGRTTTGLPIGAQLIGHPWSEELLLAIGFAYEQR